MNTLLILGAISLISFILGLIKFGSLDTKEWSWQRKFAETWNDFINFLIAGLIGYYFILIRWPLISSGEILNISDFVLFTIFMLGIFGHLCILSLNITKGVESILKRILEK